MDKPSAGQLPKHLLHPELAEDFDLRHRVRHYKRPEVTGAPTSPSVAELLNRCHQILDDLERSHRALIDAAQEDLTPDPQAWKAVVVKTSMTGYAGSTSLLIRIRIHM